MGTAVTEYRLLLFVTWTDTITFLLWALVGVGLVGMWDGGRMALMTLNKLVALENRRVNTQVEWTLKHKTAYFSSDKGKKKESRPTSSTGVFHWIKNPFSFRWKRGMTEQAPPHRPATAPASIRFSHFPGGFNALPKHQPFKPVVADAEVAGVMEVSPGKDGNVSGPVDDRASPISIASWGGFPSPHNSGKALSSEKAPASVPSSPPPVSEVFSRVASPVSQRMPARSGNTKARKIMREINTKILPGD